MATIKGTIPGIAYSQWEISADEITDEYPIEVFFGWLKVVGDAFRETFPEPAQQAVDQYPPRPSAPAQNGRRQAPVRPQGQRAGTGMYCPQHPNVEAVPSVAKYARYEEDEYGNQVQANYFCPGDRNGTGQNHQIWRRELIPA